MKNKKIFFVLAILVICNLSTIKAHATKYTDTYGHWAESTIEYLSSKGIINGYPDGSFQPDNNINVNEFIKMVVVAKQYPITVMDVQWLGWATNYAATAQVQGVIKIDEFVTGGDFERPITRYEMAKMVARAMNNEQFPPIREPFVSKIKDFAIIPDNAKELVYRAFVRGVITGYPDGEFKGYQNATRAEAAAMIARMIDKSRRVKTVDGLYSEYIEPWDLIQRIVQMEKDGDTDRILDYFTKESRELFGIQTGEQYMQVKSVSVGEWGFSHTPLTYMYNKVKAEYPDSPRLLTWAWRSKVVSYDGNKMKMFVGEFPFGDDPTTLSDMTYVWCATKIDGLWYFDLNIEPCYASECFKYWEGK